MQLLPVIVSDTAYTLVQEGITQVDATVTEKTQCNMSYTFTGTHPNRGPFRVTKTEQCKPSSVQAGDSVRVHYEKVRLP